MKRPLILLLHLAYWAVYALLVLILFSQMGAPEHNIFGNPFGFVVTVPNVLAFYLIYFWVFPRFFALKRYWAAVLFSLLTCLFSGVVGISAVMFFNIIAYGYALGFGDLLIMVIILAIIASIHSCLALVIRGFIAWFEQLAEKEELNRKNFDTELALVKAQLDPHFLFNTLNNIDTLIEKDPAKASNYLKKLSDIMRFMLYESKTASISLRDEVAYLEKYIALQKIRSANPDFVVFRVNGPLDALQIAPHILIPFVENAFKHSPNLKTGNVIDIQLGVEKGEILFTCQNLIAQKDAHTHKPGGLGRQLIARRLALLYPERHSLSIRETSDTFEVDLRVQIE